MEKQKAEGKTHFNLMLETNISEKVAKKAMEMGMAKTQYIIYCIENQPATPEFIWQSDDLNEAIETLVQISDNVKRVTDGVSMTNTVTGKDVAKLEAQYQELNGLYAALLMQYTEQRKKTTKTARRLVREWKSAERQ